MTSAELEELEIHPLFKEAFSQTSSRVNSIATDEGTRRFFASLLTGGYTTANAIVNLCDGIKKLWADGDAAKAMALTRLGTMLMLSQASRWLEDANDEKGGNSAISMGAITKVLSLFGDFSDDTIRDFAILDTQFKYETDHKSDFTHFKVFLLAKACEACGHKSLDMEKVTFPIKSMEPITRSGAILDSATLGDINNIRAIWVCHLIGTQAMTKYHEEQS